MEDDNILNEIPKIVLRNEDLKIRTIIDEENGMLFSLSDICKLLGISNTSSNREKLNKEESYKTVSNGKIAYVGINNIIRLIFHTKNDFYSELTDWLSDRVIPVLFKNGKIEFITKNESDVKDSAIDTKNDDYLDDESYKVLNKELKNQNLIFGKEIIRVTQVLMEIQNLIEDSYEEMTKVHKELQNGAK